MNLLRSPQPRAGERVEAHLGARLRILSGSGSHRQYPDDPRASKGHRARPDQLRARLQIGARFYMAPVGARRLWLGPDAQVAARERSSGTPRIAPHARGKTYRDRAGTQIGRGVVVFSVGVNEGSFCAERASSGAACGGIWSSAHGLTHWSCFFVFTGSACQPQRARIKKRVSR